jgi:hypothetical protein
MATQLPRMGENRRQLPLWRILASVQKIIVNVVDVVPIALDENRQVFEEF